MYTNLEKRKVVFAAGTQGSAQKPARVCKSMKTAEKGVER
jgi:hypothetical protein